LARYILGLSAFYHDSAAALLKDGAIIAAAHEERFSRKKQDSGFPIHATEYVMNEALINPSDLEAIVFYDKPLLKFERLLETYHAFAPRGLHSFLTAMPVWIKEKAFTRNLIRDGIKELFGSYPKSLPILFSEHHLSHAASAFYPSPYKEAAILTVDGVGEWTTTSIFKGSGAKIEVLKEQHFPHSLGLLYSSVTYYCGFKVNSGEYKLMGLAPYGNANSAETQKFKDLILSELMELKEDGSFKLRMRNFNFAAGLTMVEDPVWEEIFGIKRRKSESDELTQSHMNLALAIQQVTDEILLRLAKTAQQLTGSESLVLAGGVALNCVANGKLLRSGLFKKIWIQPAAGDAGGALGAAQAAWHIHFDQPRTHATEADSMSGAYLGPEFSDTFIQKTLSRFEIPFQFFENFDQLCEKAARLLSEDHVVGWFQGRMEWGPRALGNRSILGDPRSEDMQKKLNLKIKYREGFRPFAPSVRIEDASTYFELETDSPYMLLVADVREDLRFPEPSGYSELPLYERLYHKRSKLPAITHIDYSARIQTVDKKTNEPYWKLLTAFKEQTGYGLVVNTSFNVRGEPIVCSPEDAIRCFLHTEMDALVLGKHLLLKSDMTNEIKDQFSKEKFEKD